MLIVIYFFNFANHSSRIVIADDDDDDDDDDERKNLKKTKLVSNDRSGHDDQFCPKIVKIGAILAIFRPFEDFGNMPKINQNHSC